MTIDDFDAFLDTMTPEQLTLYLARLGVSPSDAQAGLDRALKMIREHTPTGDAERPWEEYELHRPSERP